jgi:hypothetical protein
MDNNLENRIQALEEWKDKQDKQQIKFPLDTDSITILSKYFMRILNSITFIGGVSGTETTIYTGRQDNIKFQVSRDDYFTYQVDTSTDILTTNVYLDDGTNIIILSSGATPAPLLSGNNYYVRDSTGTSFKLASTLGGAALDITTTGTGTQYINIF